MPRASNRSVQRRPTFWAGADSSDYVALGPSASTLADVILEGTLENVPNPTIVRMRGWLHIASSDVGAANDDVRWGAGICLVNSKQRTVGVTAMQLPLTNADWDGWMWWSTGIVREITGSLFADGMSFERREIDSKAMRKVSANESLIAVFETRNAAGTNGILISCGLRVLIKR